MRPCPRCAQPVMEQAAACLHCGTTIIPEGGGETGTSWKAIVSLICGLLFFILPSAIVAVIMGHLSLSDIKRNAGRLSGRGMAIAGLVLGYLGLAIIPVLIIAAIAIPNLLRAKLAANEASAVGSLRRINTACVLYANENKTYPATLEDLTTLSSKTDRIDDILASGQKSGYGFRYQAGPSQDGVSAAYEVHADPLVAGTTGLRHFYTDQSGVLRVSSRGRANADSPELR